MTDYARYSSYMNITIGLVVPMIGYLYYANEGSAVPTVPADVVKGGLAVRTPISSLLNA